MNIKQNAKELNQMILEGKILDAFDKFYAPNVVMAEGESVREGFDACRQFEVDFVNNLTEFRGAEVRNMAVNEEDGVAMTEWWMDYSHKEWGDMNYTQIARQEWKDGKIVKETFFKNA